MQIPRTLILSLLALSSPAVLAATTTQSLKKERAPVVAQEIDVEEEVRSEDMSLARPNTISLEILGRSGLYTVSYDHSISSVVSLGVGISYLGSLPGFKNVMLFPVYTNFYFSPGASRGFATAGLTFGTASDDPDSFFGNPSKSDFYTGIGGNVGFGYEYRGHDGFLFRIAPYIFIGHVILPWIGLTAGVAF